MHRRIPPMCSLSGGCYPVVVVDGLLGFGFTLETVVRIQLVDDSDIRFNGSKTHEEKDAMCYQVFQGYSYIPMSVFALNTKVMEEYVQRNIKIFLNLRMPVTQ
jgi:hypothetical protein